MDTQLSNSQLINADSGNYEYYTPQQIIGAARNTMQGIDLDPASSLIANDRVKASVFYTENDDGLSKKWFGKVFMNHPFSRKNNPLFVKKLVDEYVAGNVKEACCITYASTSEVWFRPLMDYPQCFIHGRTNYHLPDGKIKKGVTKGSVVTYLGNNVDEFKLYFKEIGTVKI